MSATPSTAGIQSGDILAEKYRVDRVLGQGGMGVVVLAEHIELRERVAIKFLLDEAAGNVELAERFIREARAAVSIKSEHVVRVIDVGRLPSSAPYMVMEYLDGQDLEQRLLAGPLPLAEAVDTIIQCCEAMHVAHRAGIVHRDLKPANLFATERPDGSRLIKILDFGISKVKSPEGAQLSLTHTQAMMGSPLYMSPEQMRSSKDVSASADIWSLGVILFELLAGDVPFSGDTFPEVLVKVMGEAPPSLRGLRPEVPEGLEAVVLRCLEKSPARRYSSVAALAVALTPFASAGTLGLQSRLAASMTDPPALGAGRAVAATRLDGGAPAAAPLIVPARVTTPYGASPAAEASPSKTHTAWGAPAPAPVGGAGRARRRTVALGAGAVLVLGLVAAGLLRGARAPDLGAEAQPAGAAAVASGASGTSAPSSATAGGAGPLAEPAPASVEAPARGDAPPPRVSPAADADRVPKAVEVDSSASASLTLGASARAPKAAAAAPADPEPVPAASRSRSAAQRSTRTPRPRAGAAVRARAGSAPSEQPAPPPATKARPKPLSIEFK